MTLERQQIGLEQLQIAVYNALTTTGFPVFQYLPESAPYPFIQMGEEYTVPNHTKTRTHFEVYHVIHTFAKSKSKSTINAMNAAIVEVLTQDLPLSGGFYISNFRLDNGITVLDPTEEALWHGTFRFYYLVSY